MNFRSSDSLVAQIGLLLYALPSLGILILNKHAVPLVLAGLDNKIALMFAVFGAIIFVLFGYDFDYDSPDKPSVPRTDDGCIDADVWLDIVLTEYREIAKEFRQKDTMMTRSIYLSFAIYGTLALGVMQSKVYQPILTMAGSLIAFLFLVSITSMMGSREQYLERMEDIERDPLFNGKLTVQHNGRIRDRPIVTNFSASTFIAALHKLTVIAWFLSYMYTLAVFSL